jgi:hypothetical protein
MELWRNLNFLRQSACWRTLSETIIGVSIKQAYRKLSCSSHFPVDVLHPLARSVQNFDARKIMMRINMENAYEIEIISDNSQCEYNVNASCIILKMSTQQISNCIPLGGSKLNKQSYC